MLYTTWGGSWSLKLINSPLLPVSVLSWKLVWGIQEFLEFHDLDPYYSQGFLFVTGILVQ